MADKYNRNGYRYNQEESFIATLMVRPKESDPKFTTGTGHLPSVGFVRPTAEFQQMVLTDEQRDKGWGSLAVNNIGLKTDDRLMAMKRQPDETQQNFHFMLFDFDDKTRFMNYGIRMLGGPHDGKYLGKRSDNHLCPYSSWDDASWFYVGLVPRKNDIKPDARVNYIGMMASKDGQHLKLWGHEKEAAADNWYVFLTAGPGGVGSDLDLHIRHTDIPAYATRKDYDMV
ncbi:hypothetical protein ACWD7F_27865 [Streptomyces sp. NPDC005122]